MERMAVGCWGTVRDGEDIGDPSGLRLQIRDKDFASRKHALKHFYQVSVEKTKHTTEN